MIDKLASVIHSQVKQVPSEGNRKNEGDNKRRQAGQKENQKEKKREAQDHICAGQDSTRIEDIIEALNSDEYYNSKGMSFSLSVGDDAQLVFVKNSNEEIIQRLEISQARSLFQRLQSKQSKDRPVKGGILNING